MTGPPAVHVPRLVADDAIPNAPAHVLADVGGGAGPAARTTVRLGFTADAFFALFEAPAEPPLTLTRASGGEVFLDECVEVFLASPGTPSLYQEIVVSPAGALYGARVRNPDDSRATWQLAPGEGLAGVSAEVSGVPRGKAPSEWNHWRCLLRIPWASLPGGRPPGAREERRGNAYRIARGRTTRFLALSPTLRDRPPDFHVPTRFARFTFG
ncbi:MAG TPA: carbohydrate-binding family 9-like protein [Thermoanaerobaculia bacterium]|nr:carbohydrate-binding family 9-like protein [Thermoanaerobaculia bacterium]